MANGLQLLSLLYFFLKYDLGMSLIESIGIETFASIIKIDLSTVFLAVSMYLIINQTAFQRMRKRHEDGASSSGHGGCEASSSSGHCRIEGPLFSAEVMSRRRRWFQEREGEDEEHEEGRGANEEQELTGNIQNLEINPSRNDGQVTVEAKDEEKSTENVDNQATTMAENVEEENPGNMEGRQTEIASSSSGHGGNEGQESIENAENRSGNEDEKQELSENSKNREEQKAAGKKVEIRKPEPPLNPGAVRWEDAIERLVDMAMEKYKKAKETPDKKRK